MNTSATRAATVVGGGIGGLATALALHRTGWDVAVRERRTSLDRGGAGLVLWPNALRCLDTLGVGDLVRRRAVALGGATIRRADGRLLSRMTPGTEAGGLVSILRADLVDTLASALAPDVLTLGTEVVEVDSTMGDLVVGADGLYSIVRRSLDATALPEQRGYTVWRAVLPPGVADPADAPELCETWGAGVRFGSVPLGGGASYVYASAASAPDAPTSGGAGSAEAELAWLQGLLAGWHAPVPALLRALEPGMLLRHDILDLPPGRTRLHRGSSALVGDAGHAMEPNLGQGAGLALEDAVVLAHVLAAEPSVARALATYDALRAPRVARLARQSRRIGRVSRLSHPTVVALRDAAVRMTPVRVSRWTSDAVTEWRPPAVLPIPSSSTPQEPS